MNWAELVPLAISRLAAARLRALLTMLGVIIGVGSIVALVSVAAALVAAGALLAYLAWRLS